MAVTTIGGNTFAVGTFSVPFTPALVVAATTVEQTLTAPGVRVGDVVNVSGPAMTAGISIGQARVTAANTLAVAFSNVTAGSLTPPAGTYQVLVIRPEYSNATSFSP